jgi:aspartate/methionine/tyrosine aminotransferase
MHPLPFYLDDSAPIGPQLDAAIAQAAKRGIRVCALLVTNPNNPLGTIYSQDIVRAMIAYCMHSKVHYIR